MRRKVKKGPVKGTIAIIVSLLLGSAILRVSLSATEVMANSNDPIAETKLAAVDSLTEEPPSSKLLQAMLRREQHVSLQEEDLAKRKKMLDVAQFEIERRLKALVQAEDQLSATLAAASTAADDDVNQLIQMYENMKPKDTAALFETMDPTFAAGFLGRMRPETAASIMSGLTPQAAYMISAILAGRNADIPKN